MLIWSSRRLSNVFVVRSLLEFNEASSRRKITYSSFTEFTLSGLLEVTGNHNPELF